MLRGREAERDENFCKILCENYNITLYTKRVNVKALAAEQNISEELCGRKERYRFFAELSEKLHAKIATAHTASDNAETLIFNLTRGASVFGAAGIPPKRGSIIRPLIGCTRDVIERYCRENSLEYMTDSTNLGNDYTRNKIRHHVIPVLKELNPRLEQAATRFTESAAAAGEYIHSQAAQALKNAETEYGYMADALLQNDEAVLQEALMILIKKKAAFSAETRHLSLLKNILKNGGAVDFGAYTAVCKQNLLRFVKEQQRINNLEIHFERDISFAYRGKIISASINNSNSELKTLVFRNRTAGDTFTYPKRNVTKPLRKVLNELKIPAELRDSLVLLCDGSTVLWCEGAGYSKQGEALKYSSDLQITSINKGV